MCFFKKIYSSITSDLHETTTTPSDDPVTKMEAAQKMIQQSPRLAQGYLTSGQLYKQQEELYEALSIYQQGLRNVSTRHVEYAKLQREKNSILFMLATQRPNGNFMYQFPNEILYLIFRRLGIRDLIRCSGVCQAWNKFMLEWPEFWDLFWAVTDRVEWQCAEMILRRKTSKLNVLPGMELESIFNLLRLVDDSDNQLVKKLTLCEANLGFFIFDKTPDILQSLKFPIRKLELIDCYTSLQTTFYISLLSKLSNFTHVSFSQTTLSPTGRTDYAVYAPREQDIIKTSITFPFLTSLKLSAIYLGKSATTGITRILRQSPNLVHLYLDTRATILQSYIARQATEHCLFLETLVFSKSAVMVQTLSTTSEDSPIVKTKPEPSNPSIQPHQLKLRRFVFTEYSAYYNTNYVPSVIEKARHSLELLFLCINYTYTLNYLPDFGGSRLREVQLFPDECMVSPKFSRAKLNRLLSSFFRSCPALEIVVISGKTEYGKKSEFISVDNGLLQNIAEYCPRICHLLLSSCNHHSRDAILNFAAIGGSRLIHLEIDMDPAKAQALVEKLPLLRHLCIRDDNPYYTMGATEYDLQNVKNTLEQRGGSLVFRDFS